MYIYCRRFCAFKKQQRRRERQITTGHQQKQTEHNGKTGENTVFS